MKKLWTFFTLIFKQNIKNPVYALLLISLPLCGILFSQKNGEPPKMEVSVGLYAKESSEFVMDIFSYLEAEDDLTHFIVLDSYEELVAQIQKNELACGYVFPENFQQKLRSDQWHRSIQLLQNSQSQIAASLCNEMIFSAILHCDGVHYIQHYFSENSSLAPYAASAQTLIHTTLLKWKENSSAYHIEFEILDEDNSFHAPLTQAATEALIPFYGALMLFVFASGLFGGLQYLQQAKTGLFKSMPSSCKIMGIFFYPLAISLPTGITAALTLYCFHDQLQPSFSLNMLLYVLLITLFCGLLSRLIPSETIYATMIPLLLIFSIVIYPIFINLDTMLPGIVWLRKLLPPGYML